MSAEEELHTNSKQTLSQGFLKTALKQRFEFYARHREQQRIEEVILWHAENSGADADNTAEAKSIISFFHFFQSRLFFYYILWPSVARKTEPRYTKEIQ